MGNVGGRYSRESGGDGRNVLVKKHNQERGKQKHTHRINTEFLEVKGNLLVRLLETRSAHLG